MPLSPTSWPEGGGGGGSSPAIYTGLLATDPNTFAADVVIDAGGPVAVVVEFVPTILAGDGETFGTGAGEIGGSFGATGSRSGSVYGALGGALPYTDADANGYMSALSDREGALGSTWRYVKIHIGVYDETSGDPYGGANHPVMTGTYTVTATALT